MNLTRVVRRPRQSMVKNRVFPAAAAAITALAGAACIRMPPATGPEHAPVAAKPDPTTLEPFVLRPEWQGPCARAETIDVDLGNAAPMFVRAAHCQITGQEPPPGLVVKWTGRMRDDYYVRRIDVVRALC